MHWLLCVVIVNCILNILTKFKRIAVYMRFKSIFSGQVKLAAVCSIYILTQVVLLIIMAEYNDRSETINTNKLNVPSINSPNDTMLYFYRNDQFAHPDKHIK